jgi:hypothetical protein
MGGFEMAYRTFKLANLFDVPNDLNDPNDLNHLQHRSFG